MSEATNASSRALYRAQVRLAQAESIVEAIAAGCARVAALFDRPAATGRAAIAIRRAWLRASA